MTRIFFAALIPVFLVFATALPAHAADPTVTYDKSDPEMNDAIRAARKRLDWFLEGVESGRLPRDGASLKVAVPKSDGGAEHIWMFDFKRDGNRFEATVGNEPAYVPGMKLGDRYSFGREQISDWIYFRGEMMHGAYTLRVMLPRLPKREADQLRAVLAPLE